MTQRTRLLDVNILIALTNPSHVHHKRAHDWFPGVTTWATTPITQTAFVRLMLNPLVAGRAVQKGEVFEVLRQLITMPSHVLWPDDSSLLTPQIDTAGLIGHRQVTDFHLVNLAAERGGVLATFDRAILSALMTEDHRLIEIVS